MGALTPRLAAALKRTSRDHPLDVIVELRSPAGDAAGPRGESVADRKARFQSAAQPVKTVVEKHGGTIEDEAWINSTLKCRVPARYVDELRELADIVRIDLPRRLTREL